MSDAGHGDHGGPEPGGSADHGEVADHHPGYRDEPGDDVPGAYARREDETVREPEQAGPDDPNLVAVARANLTPEMTGWLQEVAAQVDPRLDRVAPGWRSSEQAEAARACAFGLLLGYLGRRYPHVRGELAYVAEAHPSFSTLEAGKRLATLEQIVADPQRVTAWLGPLVGVDDPDRMRSLVE